MNPKSVATFASQSADYLRCRLVGYPLKMRYPESASELQQWRTWEATAYEESSNRNSEDHGPLEVTDISETLVFKLIDAFMRGSEYNGDTMVLKFARYKYRNVQFSIQPHQATDDPLMTARKNKNHFTQRAVIVDVADKPVVLATGDIVPCLCSFQAYCDHIFPDIFSRFYKSVSSFDPKIR